MSTPNGQAPNSNYLCRNCGTINPNGTICIQCRSEFLEEIPRQTSDTEQMPLIQQFQNLFNHDLNIQTFTNMLLPMLMSQIQPNPPQQSRRRGRASRRIKRVAHRYIPSFFHTPTSQIRLINLNGLIPGQALNTQVFLFDQNEENFNSEMLTQLLNEDFDFLPATRNDISQLPTLTMTPSNLLIHPSCPICLDNFDSFSEVKQLPTCHHVFHTNCLIEWLLHHNNCPLCRTIIPSIQRPLVSLFDDHRIQELVIQTFGQQQQTTIPYLPIKTISPPQISSDVTSSDHSSSGTPQLPRFDSSSNIE